MDPDRKLLSLLESLNIRRDSTRNSNSTETNSEENLAGPSHGVGVRNSRGHSLGRPYYGEYPAGSTGRNVWDSSLQGYRNPSEYKSDRTARHYRGRGRANSHGRPQHEGSPTGNNWRSARDDSIQWTNNPLGNPRRNNSRQQSNGGYVNVSQHQRDDRNNRMPIVGFRKLLELFEMNPDDVVMELTKTQNSFYNLLEKESLSGNIIVLLIQIFSKATKSICVENRNRVMKMSTSESFTSKLKAYISGLAVQEDDERGENEFFWKNPDNFFGDLYIFFSNIFEIMYNTALDVLPLLLKATVLAINALMVEDVIIAEETLNNLRGLRTALENEQKKNETAVTATRTVKTRRHMQRPDNFWELSIFPLPHEICDPLYKPFIQENVIEGKYQDVEEYLDIHFRLLREDFVTPLRNGILHHINPDHDHRNNKQVDIRIHKCVTCVDIQISKSSCGYVFNLNMRKDFMKRLVNSKRFLHGSLVCFTRDNFNTILYGTISDRNEDLLGKGSIVVHFENSNNINIGDTFVMAENKIYFVPYYYVLKSLQVIDFTNARMQKYLVDVDVSSHPPYYMEMPSQLDLTNKAQEMELNENQTLAFTAALTNEFVVIQGPPGTGKTFLGLKVAKELLAIINGPMLVVSLTNHALDQFLEGLLDCTTNVIRVGGQSKNTALNNFNIKNRRNRQTNSRFNQVDSELKSLEAGIAYFNQYRSDIESNNTLPIKSKFSNQLNFADEIDLLKWLFNDYRIPNYILMEFPTLDEMLIYICENLQVEIEEQEMNIENLSFDDKLFDFPTREIRHTTLERIKRNITMVEKILKGVNPKGNLYLNLTTNIWRCKEIHNTLQTSLQNIDYKSPTQKMDLNLSEDTPAKDRWNCYEQVLKMEYEESVQKTREMLTMYWDTKAAIDEMSNFEDCEVMKNAQVIGMTTTAAARLQSVIGLVKAPVVIIEEAAAILEAHLIGILGKSCKHAILIGDHQQLRPSTNDYTLDVKYKLGISLFERMIMNNIPCTTLSIQHRMRPEISRLVSPSIYPHLVNAANVYDYPDVQGISKNVFFVTHANPEFGEMDSKFNQFEAEYLILLARYLVLNGHSPDSITILCAYFGQFLEMRKFAKTYESLKSVKITILDNYQGEENNIILLSLVRNNNEGRIGFLSVENRVCVALSRAKHGLYILGNMDMLSNCEKTKIWKEVKAVLVEMESLGEALPLVCQKHKNVTKIKTIRDFDNVAEGGCTLPCGKLLKCFHTCWRICHLRSHKEIPCNQPCKKTLCEFDHLCPKICSAPCGDCMVPKTCTLPCGHVANISCHMDPEDVLCSVKLVKMLPCQHEMEVKCSDDLETVKCYFPCDSRIESCGHACERNCHMFDDPEHLIYKCRKPCERNMKDCSMVKAKDESHKCQLRCFQECPPCSKKILKRRLCKHFYNIECHISPNDIICERKCKKLLPCGHPCKSSCNKSCLPSRCNIKVEKVMECGHKVTVSCSVNPATTLCKKECVKILPCGHKCKLTCNLRCSSNVCKGEVKMEMILPCKHKTDSVPCFLKDSSREDTDEIQSFLLKRQSLLSICKEPCNSKLECGHNCTGTCGECGQGRVHKRCQEKCNATLICGHSCKINCNRNCLPCKEKCSYKCKHSKCTKTCGAVCTKCKEPCPIKCQHQKCSKLCGEICDVEPCKQPCPKKLKCSHDCIGFCGDPCPPVCKICDPNHETFEIFLGNEDEPDARFVYLEDCNHVLESTALDNWFACKNDDPNQSKAIQCLVCPKCKTRINLPPRYSHQIKMVYKDMTELKQKHFGTQEDIQSEIGKLSAKFKSIFSISDGMVFQSEMVEFLQEVQILIISSKSILRKLNLSLPEIVCINSLFDLYELFHKCIRRVKNFKTSMLDIPLIKQFRSYFKNFFIENKDFQSSNQQIHDIQLELERFYRLAQFYIILNSKFLPFNEKLENCLTLITSPGRYSKELDATIKLSLNDFDSTITDLERKEIVKAIGLTKGHWFKCPNGHYYAIGECGGAMEIAVCPECKESIGGTSHRLLGNNSLAPEMDEANYPAWGDRANMSDYDSDDFSD